MAIIFPRISVYLNSLINHGKQILQPSLTTFHCQQLRHKGNKRFKLPPVAKEKEKWQPREQKVQIKAALPEDWEEISKREPNDDVWIRKYYKIPSYSFLEAIEMHRELASVEMQDNIDGLVLIDAQLDLTTKKKTKFLGAIKGNILLPFNFDNQVQNRVVAITKTEEDKENAVKAGAVFVGGLDIIRKIERGDIKPDDYDYIVLNMDMLVESALIKKHLKDRFPAKKKGNLGTDIESMTRLFANGRSYESVKESDSVGRLSVAFGKLSMPNEQLLGNIKAVIEAVTMQKSPTSGPPIFSKVGITCPPSTELFFLNDKTVMPDAVLKAKTVVIRDDDNDDDDAEGKDEDNADLERDEKSLAV